jgi:hypothetical protein
MIDCPWRFGSKMPGCNASLARHQSAMLSKAALQQGSDPNRDSGRRGRFRSWGVIEMLGVNPDRRYGYTHELA